MTTALTDEEFEWLCAYGSCQECGRPRRARLTASADGTSSHLDMVCSADPEHECC